MAALWETWYYYCGLAEFCNLVAWRSAEPQWYIQLRDSCFYGKSCYQRHNTWLTHAHIFKKNLNDSDPIPISILSSVQLLSRVRLFVTLWTAACQASLSITHSRSPPKPMSIVSVMPSNHLILGHPLLRPPSIFPSIRVFSNESALRIRWPKYWSFSFNTSPSSDIQDWFPLGWTCKIMQV